MTTLVTGAAGFIGRHVVEALGRQKDARIFAYDVNSSAEVLEEGLRSADVIVHLAGVNRPKDPKEFETGNTGFTEEICAKLKAFGRKPTIIMTSSIQAALDNPYGVSKLKAEEALGAWARESGGRAIVFRLKNVFGKWCRPNYNSVTATFCHNIAHDLPISISDPARVLELVYIDDVIAAVLGAASETNSGGKLEYREVETFYRVTLGDLAAKIQSFRESRRSLVLPSFEEEFTRRLYATYLSYFDGPQFGYALEQKTDPRGCLAEFMKSAQFGQIFVSRTKPGITRGNHYHHTKTEKFLVVEGDAVIRFRHVENNEVIEHRVSGHEFRVVDIPPGYVHSIENVGTTELVTLFWASEIFDPQRPDCYFTNVIR
ncbi:NAD-dependent epimerase/dehydratase family protein [Opitutus sp. ER46]|uniref:polysaccharide biosynthesis C-terminal domain-containing protein n=1 Tax=Opitutus sp. ER46 TaxID=2161864 RepID=UPI000D2FEE53|nr:NAD-dependent epimerase/dehydratase family protein [Opitutus sp. ER46]PTX98379.1 capsular biosynthesis protein [Opitutus sp. ER46]